MRAIHYGFVLLVKGIFCSQFADGSPRNQNTGSEFIDLASYVLRSLKDMNESGMYKEGLTLHSILWIRQIHGRYHTNTIMEVEFASPYFHSGREIESFNVVVMENFIEESMNVEQNQFSSKTTVEDKSTKLRRGYAIDRFPKMKEDEIKARTQKIGRRVVEKIR